MSTLDPSKVTALISRVLGISLTESKPGVVCLKNQNPLSTDEITIEDLDEVMVARLRVKLYFFFVLFSLAGLLGICWVREKC